jgi:hypothetical protein
MQILHPTLQYDMTLALLRSQAIFRILTRPSLSTRLLKMASSTATDPLTAGLSAIANGTEKAAVCYADVSYAII